MSCLAASRRSFLSFGAAGLAALALGSRAEARSGTSLTPDEALAKLKEGNARFVADAAACAANMKSRRAEIAKGQAPWATVLTCADSRVAPELLFGGVNLGELFVARNAGNIADVGALGTIEYGAEHLGSPLVVVLGHSKCGAVAAACDVVAKKAKIDGAIGQMIAPIVKVARTQVAQSGDFTLNTVKANALANANGMAKRSKIISHLTHEKKLRVIPAIYDLDSGAVEFLA